MDATLLDSTATPELDWTSSVLPWLVVLALLLLAASALASWMLLLQVRGLERFGKRLDALDELKVMLRKLAEERDDIDLRRLEHVVVDIRDGQRRTEDALLRAVEAAAASAAAEGGPRNGAAVKESGPTLGERVVNRLLAHGYERVQIVGPPADPEAPHTEVLVEAHRQGVLYKGRVLVREGVLSDVELAPAFSIFP